MKTKSVKLADIGTMLWYIPYKDWTGCTKNKWYFTDSEQNTKISVM